MKEINKNGAKFIEYIEETRSDKNPKIIIECIYCNQRYQMWRSHYYRGSNPCFCRYRRDDKIESIYDNMISRCYNQKINDKNYLQKGIYVCEEWRKDYYAFENWAINNGYEDGLEIDRIDYNKSYEPDNCRWVNRITQANNKSNNILFVLDNKKASLKRVCEITGINYKVAHSYYCYHNKDKHILLLYLLDRIGQNHSLIEYDENVHKELDTIS